MINHLKSLQARREQENEEGFTLIELLIVIVVLGILAAVVVFALGGVTGNAKAAACSADAKTIETAVGAYNADAPVSPADQSIGAETNGSAAGNVNVTQLATFSTGQYATDLTANTPTGSSTAYLSGWPQASANASSNNGYFLALATVDQICPVTVTANCGTAYAVAPAPPTSNTWPGLGATAGKVIVYTNKTSASGLGMTQGLNIAESGTAYSAVSTNVSQQFNYGAGVIFDTEASNLGCNAL